MNPRPHPYQGCALPLSYISMRAENGTQTRDPQLGRLVLYRLSYFRALALTLARLRERRSYSATCCATLFGLQNHVLHPEGEGFCYSRFLWVRMDSNHRSRRQQIYSLPHLATLEHTRLSKTISPLFSLGPPQILICGESVAQYVASLSGRAASHASISASESL